MKGRIGAAVLFSVLACQQADAANVAASNPAFGGYMINHVAARSSTGPRMSRAELRYGMLFFSMTIVGDSDSIAHLEEYGHLPVYVTFWGDGARFDTIDIGIKPERWATERRRLVADVKARGVFTYRTFYQTRKITYRHIELTLQDAGRSTIRTVSGSRNVNPTIELEP